jgi:hypothetical protein
MTNNRASIEDDTVEGLGVTDEEPVTITGEQFQRIRDLTLQNCILDAENSVF